MRSKTHKPANYIYLIAFFAANPEEELSTQDIKLKFEIFRTHKVGNVIDNLVCNGWLNKRSGYIGDTYRRMAYYSAGPKLLETIGWRTP